MPILTPEERIGTLISERYLLESILGVGGMGVVFAGTHTWTGRRVAVKILAPEYARDEVVVHRFLQEARTAARIRHPNVVDVLDMGEDDADGTVFLVLELLVGEPLGDVIERDGPLPPGRVLDLCLPVTQALMSAHRRGIVHRDIKPDNIFISRDSQGVFVPKLLDFGIAKVLESAKSGTRTGNVIGTPYYMSPEQAAGSSDLGPPADVWSMGVVLYECLTNKLPFSGTNPTAVLLSIACGKPIKLSSRAPHLPAVLTNCIDRALVPDRRIRYAAMREFIDALLSAAKECGIEVKTQVEIKSVAPPSMETGVELDDDPRKYKNRGDPSVKFTLPSHGGRKAVISVAGRGGKYAPDAPTLTPEAAGAPARLEPLADMTDDLESAEETEPPPSSFAAQLVGMGEKRRAILWAGMGALGVVGLVVALALVIGGSDSDPAAAQTPDIAQEAPVIEEEPTAVAVPDEAEPEAEEATEEVAEKAETEAALHAEAPNVLPEGVEAPGLTASAAGGAEAERRAEEHRRARRAQRREHRRASRAESTKNEEKRRRSTLFREW